MYFEGCHISHCSAAMDMVNFLMRTVYHDDEAVED
jgi:hypothetical protein